MRQSLLPINRRTNLKKTNEDLSQNSKDFY